MELCGILPKWGMSTKTDRRSILWFGASSSTDFFNGHFGGRRYSHSYINTHFSYMSLMTQLTTYVILRASPKQSPHDYTRTCPQNETQSPLSSILCAVPNSISGSSWYLGYVREPNSIRVRYRISGWIISVGGLLNPKPSVVCGSWSGS